MRPLTHLLILTALAVPLYALNPTALGIFTPQEAIRAHVGREMHQAGNWIVPVRRGKPYLAKPPLIYWCQRVLAMSHGATVSELEVRLNSAIWGWAGVIATYLVGRRMLRDAGADDQTKIDAAAFLGALFLELGVAYCHNSRAGEIDIMLVAPVVVCIGAIHAAWTGYLADRRTRWGAVALATGAGAVAALVKGPAPTMVIALGGYAPVLLRAFVPRDSEKSPSWLKQLQCVHPLVVLGVPLLVFWGWLKLVAARIGPDLMKAQIEIEVEDNLRMFRLSAWGHNFEAVSWSLGAFVIAGVIGLGVLATRWSSLAPGKLMLVLWFVLGFVGFSLTTQGVDRYLLPILPALSLIAGWAVRRRLELDPRPRALCAVVATAVVAQGGVMVWWEAFGRTAAWATRSPRAYMRELVTKADPARMGTLNYNADALDYYADHALEVWGKNRFGRPVAELVERLRKEDPATAKPYTLLVHEESDVNRKRFGAAESELKAAGLEWTEIPISADYRRAPGNSRLLAWNVRPAPDAPK